VQPNEEFRKNPGLLFFFREDPLWILSPRSPFGFLGIFKKGENIMDITNIILITGAAIALSIVLAYAAIRLVKDSKAKKAERGHLKKVPFFVILLCKRIAHKHHGIYSEVIQIGERTLPLVFIGDTVFAFNWATYRGKVYIPYDTKEPWIVNGKKVTNPVDYALSARDMVAQFIGPKGYRALDVVYTPLLKRKNITLDQKGVSLFTAVVFGMRNFEQIFAGTETPSDPQMAKATWNALGDAIMAMADSLKEDEKPHQESQPS
jgi:hypothetical protein